MPRYRVKSAGFYGDIYRTPGGRHDPVVTATAIKKDALPSWLELIDEKKEAAALKKRKATGQKIADEQAKLAAEAREGLAVAKGEVPDFTGDGDGVETL